ncbi:hypothetical protein ACLMJV_16995 [Sinorhizobium meliloti]|uniref:hypothetical protein n=1 Tax=Rhizobium meliloti TaxID=382 RepID=UPI00398D1965
MHRTYTLHIQEPDGAVAKLEAEAGSTFVQIGEPAAAVVMRLRAKLPRIKVSRLTPREEDQSQPL